MLVLPSRRLVHPAADDDFVACRNAPYGQVLVLPSQRLVRPADDDDFVILEYLDPNYCPYFIKMHCPSIKTLITFNTRVTKICL